MGARSCESNWDSALLAVTEAANLPQSGYAMHIFRDWRD